MYPAEIYISAIRVDNKSSVMHRRGLNDAALFRPPVELFPALVRRCSSALLTPLSTDVERGVDNFSSTCWTRSRRRPASRNGRRLTRRLDCFDYHHLDLCHWHGRVLSAVSHAVGPWSNFNVCRTGAVKNASCGSVPKG